MRLNIFFLFFLLFFINEINAQEAGILRVELIEGEDGSWFLGLIKNNEVLDTLDAFERYQGRSHSKKPQIIFDKSVCGILLSMGITEVYCLYTKKMDGSWERVAQKSFSRVLHGVKPESYESRHLVNPRTVMVLNNPAVKDPRNRQTSLRNYEPVTIHCFDIIGEEQIFTTVKQE